MLAVLLALLVPVHVALEVAGDSVRGFEIALRARALLVVRVRRVLRVGSRGDQPPPAAPAPPTTAPRTARSRGGRRVRDRVRRALLRLDVLERVVASGAVRIARPAGWLVFGCADPAETGVLFGTVSACAVLVDPHRAVDIAPLWTFEDRVAGEVALDARVVPLRLAAALAPALLAPRASHAA